MDYSFIRKLTKKVSEIEARDIFEKLSKHSIEVFIKEDTSFRNVLDQDDISERELFVSDADLSFSRELLSEIGLLNVLCDDKESNASTIKSEVEKAEEEFYRKHKQNQMMGWIIILAVCAFLLFRFIA